METSLITPFTHIAHTHVRFGRFYRVLYLKHYFFHLDKGGKTQSTIPYNDTIFEKMRYAEQKTLAPPSAEFRSAK